METVVMPGLVHLSKSEWVPALRSSAKSAAPRPGHEDSQEGTRCPSAFAMASRACEGFGPHPEELAKQASRRMDATKALAAILRDAARWPLLRMRSGGTHGELRILM